MPEEYIQIVHDPQANVWKSVNYPYGDLAKYSVGEKFLQTMRSIDANKVIDHFYDTNAIKTAKDVYEQSILIAINLQLMGVQHGDCVIFFSMNNEWTSVLTMGSILMGAVPNFFEVYLDNGSIKVKNLNTPPVAYLISIFYEEKYLNKIQRCLKQSTVQKQTQLISMNCVQLPNVKTDLLQTPEQPVDFTNFKSIEVKDTRKETLVLVLTSGSTGLPKIVQLSHALMMYGIHAWWDNAEHDGVLVVFSFSPLRWISQIQVMLQSLVLGPPSIYYEVLLHLDENDTQSLASLRKVMLGGETPSKAIFDLSKKHAVNATHYRGYGMTETSTLICCNLHINGGKPALGYEIQILDDKLQPLGVNQPGQIALSPPYPLKGYMAMDNSKYYNERGLFINGDYGYMDEEGNLHILARYKDLIKSNGEVIIPNTLEAAVTNAPEVYVALLVGFRTVANDPNETGAFFVKLHANATTTHKEEISKKVLGIMKQHLTDKQLTIIKNIHIIDSIPLTVCGKYDRGALRKLAECKSYNEK
ncbi:2-succinylbenzoate--CoA ligase-like [Musca vetustissima]|uniref:2-succinylbenzoate--CoA ligase-like n=1 Tax=Musca vetustissima TaxID=27455 RepID=UPI002AB61410|nr:2-succinylbenzoate--CoA ligase-like [Musca vetustissima]